MKMRNSISLLTRLPPARTTCPGDEKKLRKNKLNETTSSIFLISTLCAAMDDDEIEIENDKKRDEISREIISFPAILLRGAMPFFH